MAVKIFYDVRSKSPSFSNCDRSIIRCSGSQNGGVRGVFTGGTTGEINLIFFLKILRIIFIIQYIILFCLKFEVLATDVGAAEMLKNHWLYV